MASYIPSGTCTLTTGQVIGKIKIYRCHLPCHPAERPGTRFPGEEHEVREDWWELWEHRLKYQYLYCTSPLGHAGEPCGFCGQEWAKKWEEGREENEEV